MRIVGGGLEIPRSFCGVMDFPAPVQNSSFTKIRKQLLNVTCDVAHKFMSDAVEEEIKLTQNSSKETVEVDDSNQEAIHRLSIENLEQEDMSENESELTNTPDEVVASTRNIGVQGDGTWQRRGHRSYNGVFTSIGQESGKILDIDVLSSYCLQCNLYEKIHGSEGTPEWQEWFSAHLPSCTKNHIGSSGSMESSAIVDIFRRSVEKYDVKYVSYLGDGDFSTFSKILEAKPYGNHVVVTKKECCGHVQKRFGKQLRTLKEKIKSKILSDRKKIGGKGR
ncbi:uncharacterized protein LOC116415810 [Nasonia vitripennis]|uniref:Mutator-like transposase domain-containing protein n=1 Tax=Nasonia vitripennis TaxID=7425 RepID=A0A7M7PUB4_NASVI|nr:uncharacterized protein LOC116415810 [Nasonia vitripennis]